MRRFALVLLLAACKKAPPPAPPPPPRVVTYEACKAALDHEQLDEAERCFSTFSESAGAVSDPARHASALFALADIRLERGDGKGAVRYAIHAVTLRPDDEEAQETLASIAHDARDRLAEKNALSAIAQIDPDSLDAKLRYASLVASADGAEASKEAFLSYEDTRVRLLQILGKDPDPERRRMAAERLGVAKDAGTARALVLSMTDKDAGVRAEAVRAVTKIGVGVDPEIRPALKKLSTVETDVDVKSALADALK